MLLYYAFGKFTFIIIFLRGIILSLDFHYFSYNSSNTCNTTYPESFVISWITKGKKPNLNESYMLSLIHENIVLFFWKKKKNYSSCSHLLLYLYVQVYFMFLCWYTMVLIYENIGFLIFFPFYLLIYNHILSLGYKCCNLINIYCFLIYRMSLDDNHNSVVLACAKVIQCILSCDVNENFFEISEVQ